MSLDPGSRRANAQLVSDDRDVVSISITPFPTMPCCRRGAGA